MPRCSPGILATLSFSLVFGQEVPSAEKLLEEAERLAWFKAWARAEPLYAEAERLFAAGGDKRNALYARIGRVRGELPRMPVSEASQQLAGILEDPIAQSDDRLRLRCLVIKGETDEDLDPDLAEQSWREALQLAKKLGESAWANRAQGELGIVAALKGDATSTVIQLGNALRVAETNGDVPSQVRWLTVFGHGYVHLGRFEQALDLYNRALNAGAAVPELAFPVMTYLGKGNALTKLGRYKEAEQVLNQALAVATEKSAFGYQAELTLKLGLVAYEQKQAPKALDLLNQAAEFARKAGGNRILAEIALELGRIQRAHKIPAAEKTFAEGIEIARKMQDRALLPKLLAQLAEMRSSERKYTAARDLLDEASDLLEAVFAKASTPWVRTQLIGVMDEVFVARIRLEGEYTRDPRLLFEVVEQARGRVLADMLQSRPLSDLKKPAELRAGERAIAALQTRLYRAKSRAERKALLDQLFAAEGRIATASTELFSHALAKNAKHAVTLSQVQAALRNDELFLEFALAEPNSYYIAVSRAAVHLRQLPGRSNLRKLVQGLLREVQAGHEAREEARKIGAAVLSTIPNLSNKKRLIISPDEDLHQLPFDLVETAAGRRLLETHVVSYAPSGSVLALLRRQQAPHQPRLLALAVSASPSDGRTTQINSALPALGSVKRGVYDLNGTTLPPLPSATAEAKSVAAILGNNVTTLLVGNSATETDVKKQPLSDYRVLHFAVHGIVSTKFPERSAIVLRSSPSDDGLLQAREVLDLRLRAELVTLSACETGAGRIDGQEGVSNLVRPFLAAGARTVVANLWAADDTFSPVLMKEFYRLLASGADKADALRRAKLKMLDQFGAQAVPKLWSGLLMYGDGSAAVSFRSIEK